MTKPYGQEYDGPESMTDMKPTDTDELVERRIARLRELVKVITEHRFDEGEFSMRVPAEPDRDADLVISWAAARILSDRERIAEFKKIVFQKNEQKNLMQQDIDSLSAKVAEYEALVPGQIKVCEEVDNLQAKVKELEACSMFKAYTEIKADNESLRAENKRYREALEQIASTRRMTSDSHSIADELTARQVFAAEQLKGGSDD